MGLLVEVTCRSCGMVEHQIDGATMAGHQPRCAECGETRLVTPSEVVEREPTSPDWLTDPDEAELFEDERWSRRQRLVLEIAGTCECGGLFTHDAPLRCLNCRSVDLDVEQRGTAD